LKANDINVYHGNFTTDITKHLTVDLSKIAYLAVEGLRYGEASEEFDKDFLNTVK